MCYDRHSVQKSIERPGVHHFSMKKMFYSSWSRKMSEDLNNLVPWQQITRCTLEYETWDLPDLIELLICMPNLQHLTIGWIGIWGSNNFALPESQERSFQYLVEHCRLQHISILSTCTVTLIRFLTRHFRSLCSIDCKVSRIKELELIVPHFLTKCQPSKCRYLSVKHPPSENDFAQRIDEWARYQLAITNYSIRSMKNTLYIWF